MSFVVATKDKASLLLDQASSIPHLKIVVVMNGADDELVAKGKQVNIEVISLSTFEAEGAADPQDAIPPKPSDIGTICYTSGKKKNQKRIVFYFLFHFLL